MLEGLLGILAFFATLLGLVIVIIAVIIALLTHHPKRAGRVGLVFLGWIAVYAVLLLAASFTSRPQFIGAGKERCFDEMCYSVKSVVIASTLGNTPAPFKAQGNYYVLTVQLRSDSKRTAQKPSEPNLLVVDAQGKQFDSFISAGSDNGTPIGQPLTASQLWNQKIQPGETASRTVAFDLPAGIQQPGLVVTEGIGPLAAIIIGDENSFFHAKTEFLLTP
jgi:hypothetical protein